MATKQRSPNYPSIGLDGAVEAVKALYRREGRSAVAPEVAVKAWGFTALSGSARSRLAGVRQYGLIENDPQGRVRLTHRGLTVAVADQSSPEFAREMQDAALAPDIFRELYEDMREASDAALRHHLIVGRKFSEDGARRLIEAFRSTLAVANLDNSGYDGDMETLVEADSSPSFSAVGLAGGGPASDRHQPLVHSTHGQTPYRWPLYDGIEAEVTFSGGDFTPDDIELLQEYLNTVKKARSRALKMVPGHPESPVRVNSEESERPDGE
jgi:hypothetical protein